MKKVDIVKLWPLIIFAFALLVRFTFLNQFQNSPFFDSGVTGVDPSLYHEWAKELAQGYWPGDRLLYGHPFYPFLVSFLYRFWAADVYSAVVIQLLVGGLSCVLLYFIGKYIFCPEVGMVSSFIAAVYGPFLFYETLLVPSALSIFLNLSAVIMLLNVLDFPRFNRTLLGGLLLGCSVITNSSVAPFIFILIFWIIWILKAQKEKLFLHLVCFVLGILLPAAFLSLKHFTAEGRFDTFASHGGINFYVGNNPGAKGTFRAPLGFTPSAEGLSEDSSRYARTITGRQLTAAQVSEFWYEKAFVYIKTHPFLWLKLLFKKFVLFFNAVEIGDVGDYYFCKNDSPLLKFNPFVFGAIAPLGLLGMVFTRRYFRGAFLLYAGVAGIMISCMLFFVNSRYRLSSVPFLILFAGFAVFYIWQKVKARDFRRLKIYAAALAVFLLFSNARVMAVDTVTPLYNLSVIYAQKGLYDKAIDITRELLAVHPDMAAAHFNLGVCYYAKGMTDEAAAEFKEALRLNPRDRNSRYNLSVIRRQRKARKVK